MLAALLYTTIYWGVSIILTVEQYLSTFGIENENGKKWECIWESYRFGGWFPGMVTELLLTFYFLFFFFFLGFWLVLLSGPGSLCEHLCIGTVTVAGEVAYCR